MPKSSITVFMLMFPKYVFLAQEFPAKCQLLLLWLSNRNLSGPISEIETILYLVNGLTTHPECCSRSLDYSHTNYSAFSAVLLAYSSKFLELTSLRPPTCVLASVQTILPVDSPLLPVCSLKALTQAVTSLLEIHEWT